MTSGHVADMTETCRRHVADTTQNVAIWTKKRHADIRHMELSQRGGYSWFNSHISEGYAMFEQFRNGYYYHCPEAVIIGR